MTKTGEDWRTPTQTTNRTYDGQSQFLIPPSASPAVSWRRRSRWWRRRGRSSWRCFEKKRSSFRHWCRGRQVSSESWSSSCSKSRPTTLSCSISSRSCWTPWASSFKASLSAQREVGHVLYRVIRLMLRLWMHIVSGTTRDKTISE